MFLDIWAPSSGCGFSATGTLKNTAVSRHAANFLAAATINLKSASGIRRQGQGGGYARAFSTRFEDDRDLRRTLRGSCDAVE